MTPKQVAAQLRAHLSDQGSHSLVEALFLRLLGLIYLAAFASLWPQIVGLVGDQGIVPAFKLLTAMHAEYGSKVFFYSPTLFWLNMSNAALLWLCALGCLASLLLIGGIFSRWAAAACFLFYLSVSSVGQPFTGFQWDALLLEAGFLAIFAGAPLLVWAYRLLLFRLMFESGWVKLASHDPNWRNLHALRFHFMTQPLPNPVAYHAFHAPYKLLDACTAATLVIEFGAPFLLFFGRIPRCTGVALLILLQVAILLTGNYAFFNLLTIFLCLWGLDDRIVSPFTPLLTWRLPRRAGDSPRWRMAANLAVLVLLLLSGAQLVNALAPRSARLLSRPLSLLQPFEIVNGYGLFAVMTTTRPEIILEGSNDQVNWREYQFPYKPGNTHRSLPWIAPYQPRLDWQMWFAALGDYQSSNWVGGLMYRLLTGEPSVTHLLSGIPFEHPPHYMRALLYNYRFTSDEERQKTGAVWKRQLQGTWFGPVSLNGQ